MKFELICFYLIYLFYTNRLKKLSSYQEIKLVYIFVKEGIEKSYLA